MDNKNSYIKERILQIAEFKGIAKEQFIENLGQTYGNFKSKSKLTPVNSNFLEDLLSTYPEINPEWLLLGKGEILKINDQNIKESSDQIHKKNLIPLFEDVHSIGGTATVASVEAVSYPSEWIDAGDWFTGATAAIRHYGDSMKEYPSGCILALKEVTDRRLIFWGRNYCIETIEGRITKRLQKSDDKDFVIAYSTNQDKYIDGRLIHEPIDIPKDSIKKLFQVLGYVVKEYSNGPVFIQNQG